MNPCIDYHQGVCEKLAACEAIQVAAMCKKFLEMEEEKK